MATIYFVKDGSRPTNSRTIKSMPVGELERRFEGKKIVYLSPDPPEFNKANPSMYEVHVVVETESGEPLGTRFPRAGFYVIDELTPAQASELLR
jgi:hypothetical protein